MEVLNGEAKEQANPNFVKVYRVLNKHWIKHVLKTFYDLIVFFK